MALETKIDDRIVAPFLNKERQKAGKTGFSYRRAPTPDIKGNRKKFNRLFRDKVKLGEVISLPDGRYGMYQGHAQGRREIDRKTYYVLFSPVSDASEYSGRSAFSFPEEVVLKTGVFKIGYMGSLG
ncbi:hypothetical protein COX97_04180 [Candidatus Pacearchaeota archaeon CG_4_10_14_0_2_um_filter_05_32_18]|nr:MAG: hypothetical protein COX97_04180 [Candidatus Pacearchaeota archaeon CG_4_10_14_0_2_um_filter_05_32_18]